MTVKSGYTGRIATEGLITKQPIVQNYPRHAKTQRNAKYISIFQI